MYPSKSGKKFDFDHYLTVHINRTIEVLQSHQGYRGISVERGLSATVPGAELPFVAACHIAFSSKEAFLEAFMPYAAELEKDMPNYTDIKPTTQFNEVEVFENKT